MKLFVLDRIKLLQILPAEGNLISLRIINDLNNSLSFTEKEIIKYSLKVDPDNDKTTWLNDSEKEIDIGESATEIIKSSLIKLNKENKLTLEHLSLCEKFKVES